MTDWSIVDFHRHSSCRFQESPRYYRSLLCFPRESFVCCFHPWQRKGPTSVLLLSIEKEMKFFDVEDHWSNDRFTSAASNCHDGTRGGICGIAGNCERFKKRPFSVWISRLTSSSEDEDDAPFMLDKCNWSAACSNLPMLVCMSCTAFWRLFSVSVSWSPLAGRLCFRERRWRISLMDTRNAYRSKPTLNQLKCVAKKTC